MTVAHKKRLMAKSLLAFGRTSRWKTIMRKGRTERHSDGSFKGTALITIQEIEDTMDYILIEREKLQHELRKDDDTSTNTGGDEGDKHKETRESNGDTRDQA